MKRHLCSLFAAAVFVCLAVGSDARADFFAKGATLDVTYEDPTSGIRYTQNVPFTPNGAASLLDNGVLSISEQTMVVNPKTEWVQFDLQTTNGKPLTFYSEDFDVNFNNVKLTQNAGWIDNYLAFTLNGKTSGDPFFDSTIPDPFDPAIGNVANNGPYKMLTTSPFYGDVFFPNPPAAYYMYATPVGFFESSWGVDPNVNGFLAGVELQSGQLSPVPEPSSLVLCAVGAFSLSAGSWWRRRRVV